MDNLFPIAGRCDNCHKLDKRLSYFPRRDKHWLCLVCAGHGKFSVNAVEKFFTEVTDGVDSALEDANWDFPMIARFPCVEFTDWFDAGRRAEVFAELLIEVERELRNRSEECSNDMSNMSSCLPLITTSSDSPIGIMQPQHQLMNV